MNSCVLCISFNNRLFYIFSEGSEHVGGAVMESLGRSQSLRTEFVVPGPDLCFLIVGDSVALDVVELHGRRKDVGRRSYCVLAHAR